MKLRSYNTIAISAPKASFLLREWGDRPSKHYYLVKRLQSRLKKISLNIFLINSYLIEDLLDTDNYDNTATGRNIKIICRRIDNHTCCANSYGIDYIEESD